MSTRTVHADVPAAVPTAVRPDVGTDPTPDVGAEVPAAVAVHVRDLGRRFGAREVLRGIDLDIRPGEFVALLGRSGSGKSTLLRALAGLDAAVTGEILVPDRRSVAFQNARLLPWARVLDNVVIGLPGKDARARGEQALAEVGLAGHARDWPKTLSGGEGQRAALARALVNEPELLLLDEPFGALDALTRIRMHALVAELCARHHPAVLLVTHDVDEAVLLADRVLVLTDGVISLDVTVDPRFDRPRDRADARFVAMRARLLAELGVDERVGADDDLDDPVPHPPVGPTGPNPQPKETTR